MNIELKHPFKYSCVDLKYLVKDCTKVNTFINRLKKQAEKQTGYDVQKYIGDGFEFFVEALIKLSPVDNRIGIFNYEPVVNDDTGVDGYGTGSNGQPATVQVKFRSDSRQKLTANEDHLSNFLTASQNRYSVKLDDDKNMLIVTTANGLNIFTAENMLYKKVRCLGRKNLQNLVDNNYAFWTLFYQLCESYF